MSWWSIPGVLTAVVAAIIVGTVIFNARERRRQEQLAAMRPALASDEFIGRLVDASVDPSVAAFVWDEFEPYYFEPLTPYPEDRPISQFRIDPDDLSDIVTKFEKQYRRRWDGKWIGPADPTLIEFAIGLIASTSEE